MRRRQVIIFLRAVGLWPFAVHAQQAAKMKRVAMIHPAMTPADMKIGGDPTYAIVFEEMKRLGYVEGVNLIVHATPPRGGLIVTRRWCMRLSQDGLISFLR
jgi:putative tryptophan/tyrosine transport system substrate-binding protein